MTVILLQDCPSMPLISGLRSVSDAQPSRFEAQVRLSLGLVEKMGRLAMLDDNWLMLKSSAGAS
jgi:hypothetical protein